MELITLIIAISGLFISVANFLIYYKLYKKDNPNVLVDHVSIKLPSLEELQEKINDQYLDVLVEMTISNPGNTTISIGKPMLFISADEKWSWEPVNYEKQAVTIKSGEKEYLSLKYEISDENTLEQILNEFGNLKYFIEFTDNKGLKYKKGITYFISEDTSESDQS